MASGDLKSQAIGTQAIIAKTKSVTFTKNTHQWSNQQPLRSSMKIILYSLYFPFFWYQFSIKLYDGRLISIYKFSGIWSPNLLALAILIKTKN